MAIVILLAPRVGYVHVSKSFLVTGIHFLHVVLGVDAAVPRQSALKMGMGMYQGIYHCWGYVFPVSAHREKRHRHCEEDDNHQRILAR